VNDLSSASENIREVIVGSFGNVTVFADVDIATDDFGDEIDFVDLYVGDEPFALSTFEEDGMMKSLVDHFKMSNNHKALHEVNVINYVLHERLSHDPRVWREMIAEKAKQMRGISNEESDTYADSDIGLMDLLFPNGATES
jgi:hypothetical protein